MERHSHRVSRMRHADTGSDHWRLTRHTGEDCFASGERGRSPPHSSWRVRPNILVLAFSRRTAEVLGRARAGSALGFNDAGRSHGTRHGPRHGRRHGRSHGRRHGPRHHRTLTLRLPAPAEALSWSLSLSCPAPPTSADLLTEMRPHTLMRPRGHSRDEARIPEQTSSPRCLRKSSPRCLPTSSPRCLSRPGASS